ncbi:MAG: hypothetical protein E7A56_08760 [Cutibacterium avidum]|nr:hypothetical protein [Cutibacterium avidum]
MTSLREQKEELGAAIQLERVRATPTEDEGPIREFYRRYAKAMMEDPQTRKLLLEYFVDKIYVGKDRLTVASWFYDGAGPITWEEFKEATVGSHTERLVRVFNMGP